MSQQAAMDRLRDAVIVLQGHRCSQSLLMRLAITAEAMADYKPRRVIKRAAKISKD